MTRRVRQIAVLLLGWTLTTAAVSVDRIKEHIGWLSDPAREGRHAGSKGAAASADYIASKLRETGYGVQMQDFGGNRRNVIGRLGTSERYLVIGAHYDGQGAGFPSASDNASGVALVLELARELKAAQLPVSIVAVAFDDEEQGMNGSRYFTDHSPWPLDGAIAALVFDTLGRNFMDLSSPTMFVLGTEYSTELANVVQKRLRPDMLVAGTDLIGPRSDFAPFAVKQVPYLFFSNGTHKDYHGMDDSPGRIDYVQLEKDAALIGEIAHDTAALSTKPKYLNEPVYPAAEKAALEREFAEIEKQRKDVPEAYRLMFADLRVRVKTDMSRETPQLAATALLAYATPRLSLYMLTLFLGPFYEMEGKRDIAAAIYEEAIKWSEGAASQRQLQDKVKRLRP